MIKMRKNSYIINTQYIFYRITEGDFMKRKNWLNFKTDMWKVVASLALIVTTVSVNTTCMFQYYQPKMPKGSEKLKHS